MCQISKEVQTFWQCMDFVLASVAVAVSGRRCQRMLAMIGADGMELGSRV